MEPAFLRWLHSLLLIARRPIPSEQSSNDEKNFIYSGMGTAIKYIQL